jgi:hypothetical protein
MQAARRGCWQQARPLPFSSSQHSVTRCSRRSRRSTGRGRAACVRVAATHVPYKDLLAVAEATALAGAEVRASEDAVAAAAAAAGHDACARHTLAHTPVPRTPRARRW